MNEEEGVGENIVLRGLRKRVLESQGAKVIMRKRAKVWRGVGVITLACILKTFHIPRRRDRHSHSFFPARPDLPNFYVRGQKIT